MGHPAAARLGDDFTTGGKEIAANDGLAAAIHAYGRVDAEALDVVGNTKHLKPFPSFP